VELRPRGKMKSTSELFVFFAYWQSIHLNCKAKLGKNIRTSFITLVRSTVDFSIFKMNFIGTTQHCGNEAGANCSNYAQKALVSCWSSPERRSSQMLSH
jgi:hypothetical protein